jgi:hypothetical protein
MKTILYLLIAVFSATITLAQPNNLGFENWTDGKPDGWWSLDNIAPLPPGVAFVSQSTDANSGNYAAKIQVLDLLGGIPSVLALSDITKKETKNGIPYTLRPADFSFFAKYNLLDDDSLIVVITLTKWNGTSTIEVGSGGLILTGSQATFSKFTVPINYKTTDTPDSLQIIFGVGGELGSEPNSTPGSYAIIDDIDILRGGPSNTVPNPPSRLTTSIFRIASSGIRLSWQDNSDNETQFVIQRATDVEGPFTDLATVAADVTTYDDVDVVNGITYYYRVLAANGNGRSAPSNVASATAVISSINKNVESKIAIYPNPNYGKFKIDFPSEWSNCSISVFDITGKEVFYGMNIREISLDVGKGTYILKIQHEKDIVHKRIIIE